MTMSERLPSVMDPENSAATVEIFDVIPQALDVVATEHTPDVINQPPEIDAPFAVTETAPPLEKPSFEQNVATVMECVGDRIFTYKQHSGTAAEMAAMCPMAKMAFMRGPEFAISFLEKFDGTPPDPEKKEEPQPEEIKADEPDKPQPDEAKKESTEVKEKSVTYSQKAEQLTVLEVVAKAEKKAAEAKSVETAETGRKAPIMVAMVAQVAIAATKNEVPESSHVSVDATAFKAKEDQSNSVIVQEAVGDAQAEDAQKGKQTITETTKNNQPPLPLPVATKQEETKAISRVGNEKTQELDAKVEIESVQPITMNDTEPESIVPKAESTIETLEEAKESKAIELPTITAAGTEPQTVIDELGTTIDLEDEEIVHEYETAADEPQQADASETLEQTPETKSEELDRMDVIIDQSDTEPTALLAAAENKDAKEPDQKTADVLVQIIEEVTEQAERGNQSEIEKRLTMIVRSIEILKWARSGKECKDALIELKKNLEALFREQGYAEDAERLASELLKDYHLRTIDEAMNAALKNIRGMRSHAPKLMAIRHLSIGRHVVKLLFGANPGQVIVATGL